MRRLGFVFLIAPLAVIGCGDDSGTGGSGGEGGEGGATTKTTSSSTTTGSTTTSTTTGMNLCGNDMIDGSEECDGTDLGGADCASEGFLGGNLACAANCTFDTSACFNSMCGNDMVEGNETCDGTDLDGEDCLSQGFDAGTLGCDANCMGFDTSDCQTFTCGDMMVNGMEDCDGADLGGADCVSEGFDGGMLACANNCAFDTSGCLTEICVDGIDNDADTQVDCADASCTAECADACNTVPTIADPSTTNGDTTGHADNFDASCPTGFGSNAGGEVVYMVMPAITGAMDIVLSSPTDQGISAWSACGTGELACSDSFFGGTDEKITVAVTMGTPVYIMVEGFDGTESGPFTIDVSSRAIVCGDTLVDPGEECDDGNMVSDDGCSATCTIECGDAVCGPNEDSCSCAADCVDDPNTCSSCECGASGGAGDLCWCDALCVANGDCCANVVPACGQQVTITSTAGVAIPDSIYNGTLASMGCAQIPASATGTVFSVDSVTYAGDHTWVGDLTFKLLSPGNATTVTLMSRPGTAETLDNGTTGGAGDSSNLITTSPITFSTGGTTDAELMGSGSLTSAQFVCQDDMLCSYFPNPGAAAPGDLGTFAGDAVNGSWQFCGGDSNGADVGDIDSVSVTMTIIP